MDTKDSLKKLDDSCAESSALCKCGSMLKKLCSLRIRDSLDFKMSVVGKDEGDSREVEYCTKQIKSDSEYELVRTLGIVAAVCVCVSLVCSVCSLIKKL